MLGRIYHYILFTIGRAIVSAQSFVAWWRTRDMPTVVHVEAPYDGRPIMLLALFQKGLLRPDVVRMLEHARRAGFYVVGVNTLKLRDPAGIAGLIDCYMERPNYGRDFGSYKAGFLHIYARGMDQTCQRLLMVNDSVYFSSGQMAKFLTDIMVGSQVLGATENHEIDHHLGSFCISMAGGVLRAPAVRAYWEAYKLTDVRPRVIKTGEMRLSRTLKGAVMSPREFVALYSATRFAAQVEHDDALLHFAMRNGRSANINHWKRITPKAALDYLSTRFLVPFNPAASFEQPKPKQFRKPEGMPQASLAESAFVADYDDFVKFVHNRVGEAGNINETALRSMTAAYAAEVFMEGSQIHQNAAILLAMGLPIIKLDGLYRGMFNLADVRTLTDQLPTDEAEELRALLMERPFGGDTLIGWKRAAFLRGYI